MAEDIQTTGFYVIGNNLITAEPGQCVHFNEAHYGSAKEFDSLAALEQAYQQSNPIRFKDYLRAVYPDKFAKLYPSEVVSESAVLGEWDADTDYAEGDVVTHDGQAYVAAPDVATGYAPDDVYDRSAGKGGWFPVEVMQ